MGLEAKFGTWKCRWTDLKSTQWWTSVNYACFHSCICSVGFVKHSYIFFIANGLVATTILYQSVSFIPLFPFSIIYRLCVFIVSFLHSLSLDIWIAVVSIIFHDESTQWHICKSLHLSPTFIYIFMIALSDNVFKFLRIYTALESDREASVLQSFNVCFLVLRAATLTTQLDFSLWKHRAKRNSL